MIFGNFGNMTDMMKKVKEMQDNLKKVQAELAEESYESEAGGVKCSVSGDMEVKEIKIDPNIFKSGNVSHLESLVTEAVSSAMHEAKNTAKDKLRKVTGGLSIPGLF